MKTAKAQRTGLVGEGEFIPNQVAMPAPDLVQLHKDLAALKAERDELREALVSICDASEQFFEERIGSIRDIGNHEPSPLDKARAVLKRTEPK